MSVVPFIGCVKPQLKAMSPAMCGPKLCVSNQLCNCMGVARAGAPLLFATRRKTQQNAKRIKDRISFSNFCPFTLPHTACRPDSQCPALRTTGVPSAGQSGLHEQVHTKTTAKTDASPPPRPQRNVGRAQGGRRLRLPFQGCAGSAARRTQRTPQQHACDPNVDSSCCWQLSLLATRASASRTC